MTLKKGFIGKLFKAKIADAVERRKRRVADYGFGGVDEFTGSDSSRSKHSSAG